MRPRMPIAERSLIALLVIIIAYCAALIAGCDVLPVTNETSQRAASEIRAGIDVQAEAIEEVNEKIDNRTTQITNQIAPLIWMVIGLGILVLIGYLAPLVANMIQNRHLKK